ncbi:SRPBCC family protein [Planococcus sp. CAU13]|uniref:SRPBCC family protein n=1 Tax=Planococcus sp. CAU13 TaxID=1541197 RepID=UPI00052FE4C3|nr:SRPBCC family protein [Planococcus sp. CAU13]
MIEWEEERVIQQNIEKVWSLFADANIRKIMPQVKKHELIEKTEQETGAKHMQTFREGKRTESYVVETLAYEDQPEKKHKQIFFTIAKAFEVDLCFTLIKLSDNETKFIYSGCNQGRNFIGKAMMKMASNKSNLKTVEDFLDRVEQEALKV